MSTSGALYTSASLKSANAPAFSSMERILDPALSQALKDMDFDYMTPVQDQVLNRLPSMSSDCLVQAKTGTGKTTAFLLPAIQNTLQGSPRKGQVSILVLSPTRELALQIAAEAERLVSKLKRPLEVHTAFGGTAKASSLNKFSHGDPKILVATPGRLNDYLSELEIRGRFKDMKTLILDEADRMLDAGFLPAILQVLRALPPKNGPNGQWQGMCFSATIPPKMQQVFSHVLKQDYIPISTIDASEPPTLSKVPQFSVVIPSVNQTFTVLSSLLSEEIKAATDEPKIICFGTTANLVALYAKAFQNELNIPVYELHSRLSQPARTRTTTEFKAAKRGIMFASDVIGRGMDFPDVSLVLQVGLPADTDSYTHRVGRTARAGKDGRAILLLTQVESFYLRSNPQFPIKPYPIAGKVMAEWTGGTINLALQNVDAKTKQKAYAAYLGFMKGFTNKMQMDNDGLVRMANDLALHAMLCDEVPEIEKRTIGKMGLKGVKGIRYAKAETSASLGHKQTNPNPQTVADASTRRMKHQGMPEPQRRAFPRHAYPSGRYANSNGSSALPGDRRPLEGGRGPHSGPYGKQKRKAGKELRRVDTRHPTEPQFVMS